MKKLFVLLLSVVLISAFVGCGENYSLPLTVASPDGRVAITIDTLEGIPVYSVSYDDKPVIVKSTLGLTLDVYGEIAAGKLYAVKKEEIHETFENPVGKSKSVENHANQIIVSFQTDNAKKQRYDLIFRAYNDGAAFRYHLPTQKDMAGFAITKENTEFQFADNYTMWAAELNSFTTSYEHEFLPVAINDVKPESIFGLPITMQVPDGPTVCLTEAALVDYAGLYVKGSGNNTLSAMLSPLPGDKNICVRSKTPMATPWRVLIIADKPAQLLESNLILCLNEPCKIEDTSWIKPGIVAWDWWSGPVTEGHVKTGMNNETMKYFIDFAAKNGWEYMLIDAGWYGNHRDENSSPLQTIPEIDMPGLVQYAGEKNVDILIWLHWAVLDGIQDKAFALYESWGVKGVKIDYMNRDDQQMVNFYNKTVEIAAKHHLTVDFHGAYKPTGIRRTWPNLMTREGIMGLEYLKWSDRANPEHNVTTPYTRLVAGPMDFTPGGFLNSTSEKFKSRNESPLTLGTRCHQLAMFVVYESYLQMAADSPKHYKNQKGLSFINTVPASWDETHAIDGEIGDYIAMARRSGKTWFVGAMTDWTARTLELDMSFLPEGEYNVTVYSDGPGADKTPTRVAVTTTQITSTNKLKAELASGGGFAAVIEPVQ